MKYGWNHQTQRLVAPKLENYGKAFDNTYKLIQDKLALEEKRKQIEEQRQFQIDRENQRHTWDTQRDTQIHDWKKEDMGTQHTWNVEAADKKFDRDAGLQSSRLTAQFGLHQMDNEARKDVSKMNNKARMDVARLKERSATERTRIAQRGANYRALLPSKLAKEKAKQFKDLYNSDPNLRKIFSSDTMVYNTVKGEPITEKDYKAASKEFDRTHKNYGIKFNKAVENLKKYNSSKNNIPTEIKKAIGDLDLNDKDYDKKLNSVIHYYLTKNGVINKYSKKSKLVEYYKNNAMGYFNTLKTINALAESKTNYINNSAPDKVIGYKDKQEVDIAGSVKNIDSSMNNILNQIAANADNPVLQQALGAKFKYLQGEKNRLVKEQNNGNIAKANYATEVKKLEGKRMANIADKIKAQNNYLENSDLRKQYKSFTEYWDSLKQR